MKKRMYVLISLLLIIGFTGLVYSQYTKYFTTSHRMYTATATHADTSVWRTTNYKQFIEIYTVANNVDSCKLVTVVQGKFQSHLKTVGTNTCELTKASGTVTPGVAAFLELRGVANSLGVPDSIRTITTVYRYTVTNVADTNAWYSVYCIMR